MFNFPKNFYSDVRIEHNYSSKIRIKDGRLEEIKESTNIGAFIRLFDGKKWYYTSTTDLKSIDKELANLASFATPNPDINNHPVVLKFQNPHGRLSWQWGFSLHFNLSSFNELGDFFFSVDVDEFHMIVKRCQFFEEVEIVGNLQVNATVEGGIHVEMQVVVHHSHRDIVRIGFQGAGVSRVYDIGAVDGGCEAISIHALDMFRGDELEVERGGISGVEFFFGSRTELLWSTAHGEAFFNVSAST